MYVMKDKVRLYSLFLYHNDILVGRYKIRTNDMKVLSIAFSENLIRDGFSKGFNLPKQVLWFQTFCDSIAKNVNNCIKLKSHDFQMFLATKLALYRLNKTDDNDFLFLRDKRTSLISRKKNSDGNYNDYYIQRKKKQRPKNLPKK